MKIILLADVENLGKRGDCVEVRDGYARNYLIPKKLAILATPSIIKHWEDNKRIQNEVKSARLKRLTAIANKINRLTFKATLKGGKEGVFGSVTDQEISEFLRMKNIIIDKKQIESFEPLKRPGVYDVQINLGDGISAILKVWITKKEEENG